ncbi:Ectopic P Granules Protein 5-like [Manis pentadactyla]|nr:Ectopic P Granules Protein 5-like [Manis pentadactyla]
MQTLHGPRLPAGGAVSAPATTAARPSQRGERRGPEGAAAAAGSGRSGRRGPTWKRRGAAVELPAAATRASAVAGAGNGHGGGAFASCSWRLTPCERYQVVLVHPYK